MPLISLGHNLRLLRSAILWRTGSSWKLENLLQKYSLADVISFDVTVIYEAAFPSTLEMTFFEYVVISNTCTK